MSKVLRLSDTGGEIPKGYKIHDGDILVPSNTNVVWTPSKGSQTLALNCPAQIILYSGSRGNGKSDCQILRFRKLVGMGYGRYLRGIIVDRTYGALDDLVSKSKRYFPAFNDGAKFYSSKGEYKWVWRDGEELLFRSIADENDYQKLHGQEFQYIGINEISQYPDLSVLDLLSSLNRTSFVPSEHPREDGTIPPEIPLCIFLTSNPTGRSALEVKRRFVDVGKNGEIVKREVKIFNPRTQKEEIIVKTQCHIFGSYKENTKLSPEYVADLESIRDEKLRKKWLLGQWDGVGEDDGMYADVYDKDIHIVEPFDIPKEWKIDRCMDFGESSPSSIGYFAESNGEDIILRNGKTRSTVKGDLFYFSEIYTCLDGYLNKGTRILPHDLAKMITEHELSIGIYDRVIPGVADTAIFSNNMGNSVAGMMDKPVTIGNKVYPGVKWRRLDSLKKPGSRVDGVKKIRERFANAKTTPERPFRDKPALFIFNTCKYFIDIIPYSVRDPKNPDDVIGSGDHINDMLRYKLLSLNTGMTSGKTVGLT
jgi:hypothetical protein